MKIKILFWLYRSKVNREGKAPIYLRITVNGKQVAMSTGYYIKPIEWDSKKHQVKGNSESSVLINNYLVATRSKLLQIQNSINLASSPDISAELIKEKLLGVSSEKKFLLQLFEYHNSQMKDQIGKGFAVGTYKHYLTTYDKVAKFIKHTYKLDDVSLESLSHKFITDFEFYLKTVENLASNTAMKKIKQLKKIITLAIANEWIDKNPFSNFKCNYKDPKREALTIAEINLLADKKFLTDRLTTIRDVFLFGCYTGLRFSDIQKLTTRNIVTGSDGKKSLVVDTIKTGDRCQIPLLEPALKLIDQYSCNAECLQRDTLFPVRSNQKTNEFLKEIADITGIEKNLHFHLARHTFATTITLNNGVSLEAVSEMLGHNNIRTTQIYAKMNNSRVNNEMNLVRSRLEVLAS